MIFEKKRQEMIERLKQHGIWDEKVLSAMSKVPRHRFVAPGLELQAYDEKALPIGFGQTISHPYTVALMTQHLNVKKNDRILEIGTGSGYQAAVLCEMGASVFSIERIKQIATTAKKKLENLNYHCILRVGDGTLGWQHYAPFDGIIVTAGAPVVPEQLKEQLKQDARLIIPVGDKDSQQLFCYLKTEDTLEEKMIEHLKFVPLIGASGWKKI